MHENILEGSLKFDHFFIVVEKPIDIHIPRENMLSDIVERTQVRLKGSSQIR